MAPKQFPLFRLPLVVLSIIFQSMIPHEVIRLSMISKRSYNVGKALKKKPKKDLEVFFCYIASIGFHYEGYLDPIFYVSESSDHPRNADLKIFKFRDTEVKIQMDGKNDSMHIYCDNDRLTAFRVFAELVLDFYDLPIHRLVLGAEKKMSDPKRVIDWIMSRQREIPIGRYECRFSGDEELRYFLDTCKVTESLVLSMQTSEDFEYTFKQPLNLETFQTTKTATWTSVLNLFDINSRFICMQNTNFTSEDINMFLINFLNGSNSNLGLLYLHLPSTNRQIILDGIEFRQINHPNEIRYTFVDNREYSFDWSFEIRKNDGTIVSLLLDNHGSVMMLVWPDWKGQPYPAQELD